VVPKAVQEHAFLVSELADYELRRELLRLGATRSLSRLDELTRELPYLPVTTATWRRTDTMADARNAGNVTAPPKALDGDVLIAAQALEEGAVVSCSAAAFIKASVFRSATVILSPAVDYVGAAR